MGQVDKLHKPYRRNICSDVYNSFNMLKHKQKINLLQNKLKVIVYHYLKKPPSANQKIAIFSGSDIDKNILKGLSNAKWGGFLQIAISNSVNVSNYETTC